MKLRRALSVLRRRGVRVSLPLVLVGTLHAQTPSVVDRLFLDFWKAEDVRGAERVAERLLKSGADFDALYARLKTGRTYAKERTGDISLRSSAGGGAMFDNRIEIPDDYTPDRAWQVRVQLHGGVSRPPSVTVNAAQFEDDASSQGGRAPSLGRQRGDNRIRGESQIYIHPNAFAGAEWWRAHQVENVLRLVDHVKRKYHVDESRIYLTGISDGGTGAYYIAMKAPTLWSAFLPLNGSIKVLANPSVGAEGELFSSNLANRPLYIVSGGRDHLYPARDVATHVEAFTRLGLSLVFRPQPEAGHDTSWWPHERSLFEQFVKQKPRQAHPERVSWQTENTQRFNRADWLVIDALGMGSADTDFEPLDIFAHRRPSGRVDIQRSTNTFEAKTRGVKAFTILLSPDAIDFAKPISVRVNDRPAFDGVVKRDAAVLLKWAARDNERTRLYGAELRIVVP